MKKFITVILTISIFGILVLGCTDKNKVAREKEEECKLCENLDESVLEENEKKERGYCDDCWKIKTKLEESKKLEEEDLEEQKELDKKDKEKEEKKKEPIKEIKKEPKCKDCGGEFLKNKAGQEELGICFNCQAHYCYLCNKHIGESAFNDTCEKCEPTLYCKQCGKGTKDKDNMYIDINGDNICVACIQPRQGKCVGCGKIATIMNGMCEQCHEKIMEEYE